MSKERAEGYLARKALWNPDSVPEATLKEVKSLSQEELAKRISIPAFPLAGIDLRTGNMRDFI